MRRVLGALAMALLLGAPATAQVEVSGEVRPRFEARDPVDGLPTGDDAYTFTSMRARAALRAELSRNATAFVQLQDVRVWGTETGTTDPVADALDLHQGWIELGDPDTGRWSLKAGRQEIAYGGQRLVGALNWAQQGRAFDGLRLRVRPTPTLALDGLAMTVGDADAGGPRDERLYGVHGVLDAAGSLAGYVLFNTFDAEPDGVAEPVDLTDQYTVGARWATRAGPVDWRVEAAYQLGERGGEDVSAYLVGVRAGTAVTDRLGLTLWYDRLSGDDDPTDGETRVFDTLFATNHKFYGHMDLFLNIPAHTAGRGLQDLALKSAFAARPDVSVTGALHSFRLTESDGLETAHVGEELDLGLSWAYAPQVKLTGGLSWFLADEELGGFLPRAAEDQLWGYVMLDVVF